MNSVILSILGFIILIENNYHFSNFITFINIESVMIASVLIVAFFTINSFFIYPILHVFIYKITRKSFSSLNTILFIAFRLMIDTTGVYFLLNNHSKVTLISLLIPLVISIFSLLIDYLFNDVNPFHNYQS
ncbi:hypothetical protein [Ectobacillus polymachus]|uniref:hypothetical protein n=1 Tax=Ectobacillus polymachus TaxID=1508806 RepID=UPI003A86B5B2